MEEVTLVDVVKKVAQQAAAIEELRTTVTQQNLRISKLEEFVAMAHNGCQMFAQDKDMDDIVGNTPPDEPQDQDQQNQNLGGAVLDTDHDENRGVSNLMTEEEVGNTGGHSIHSFHEIVATDYGQENEEFDVKIKTKDSTSTPSTTSSRSPDISPISTPPLSIQYVVQEPSPPWRSTHVTKMGKWGQGLNLVTVPSSPEVVPESETIMLTLVWYKFEAHFVIGMNREFMILRAHYAEYLRAKGHKSVQVHGISLMFKTEQIKDEDTPEALGMTATDCTITVTVSDRGSIF